MNRDLDALTSSTLKHLREHWWDDCLHGVSRGDVAAAARASGSWTSGAAPERRRSASRGCACRRCTSSASIWSIDRVREAHAATRGINARVGYAAADACRLPFAADSFDSTYCVAVLQHIRDLSGALGEIARVTRPGGRMLIVEPDNAARYWFSSLPSGMEAFELSRRFFGGLVAVRGESPAAAVGPLVPGLLAAPASSRCRFVCSRCRWRTSACRRRVLGFAPHRRARRHRQSARRSRSAGSARIS